MTAKEVLYTKCKKGFFSDFEETYMLEAMEDYKNLSIKTLEGVKEKEGSLKPRISGFIVS